MKMHRSNWDFKVATDEEDLILKGKLFHSLRAVMISPLDLEKLIRESEGSGCRMRDEIRNVTWRQDMQRFKNSLTSVGGALLQQFGLAEGKPRMTD